MKISIKRINILVIFLFLFFVSLFTLLLLFEEYDTFISDTEKLREKYTQSETHKAEVDAKRISHYFQFLDGNSNMTDEVKSQAIETLKLLYKEDISNKRVIICDAFHESVLHVYHEEVCASKLKGYYPEIYLPWKWTVYVGINYGELETEVETERIKLYNTLIKYLLQVSTLSLITLLIAMGGVYVVNALISQDIKKFSDYFLENINEFKKMSTKEIRIIELLPLVEFVNKMVKAVHKKNKKLKRLNLTLEDKVEEKTKELRNLIEAQDCFVKQAIHETHTPLSIIRNYIDLFILKHGKDKYFEKIDAASKMMETIFEDLSFLIKRDRIDYIDDSVDLSSFLKERIRFFVDIAAGNDLDIAYDIEEGISINMNSTKLQRLIDNNLTNSIKYSFEDSVITVKLFRKESKLEMSFYSHSQKIHNPEKIFDAFYRENQSCKGFGIGLNIVKEICDEYGITVTIDSSEERTLFNYTFVEGENENIAA